MNQETTLPAQRGLAETYLLGMADDLPSTQRLLAVSRLTHWVCFLMAVGAALVFANQFFATGNLWSESPDQVTDRALLQIVAHQLIWLFIAGVALLAGFISWLNTDVLVNRKLMLEQRFLAQPAMRVAPQEAPEMTTVLPRSDADTLHQSRSS
ncbi:MAG TPA: hypothetical protein VFB38_22875 [Chthonomonadaceae bacterium]|nr:hypothetical protein [Chthonomonadaceae bacterium]